MNGGKAVLLVVLLMFGQLRPYFPQGKQSLTPASMQYTVSLAPFLPHSCMGHSARSIFTFILHSIQFGQWWKVEKYVQFTQIYLKFCMKFCASVQVEFSQHIFPFIPLHCSSLFIVIIL